MSENSDIEWLRNPDGSKGMTWNPTTGCEDASEGCHNCYARTLAERFRGTPGHYFEHGFDVSLRPDKLDAPLRRRKPTFVFVDSMADLFHQAVPDDYIARVFAVMAACPQHTFLLLSKRHARMRTLLNDPEFRHQVYDLAAELDRAGVFDPYRYAPGHLVPAHYERPAGHRADDGDWWPLPNLWVGVSVENQAWAQIRTPALLETLAAKRWLSCEPLLGPVELRNLAARGAVIDALAGEVTMRSGEVVAAAALDWVVAGGESGVSGGKRPVRPMHPDWVRGLRDQCVAGGVPFWFKQWGQFLPVPVLDAPELVGGRAFDHPRGGRMAAAIRELGPSGTLRGGVIRPMRPGDVAKGSQMLDEHWIAVRVGKRAAGHIVDGRTWEQRPHPAHYELLA